MITSEMRPGSTSARSSAALMAMAPRSWAGMVANAPLKLPTGVRAALTMTTSSDMDILLGLRVLDGGRRIGRPLSPLYPVNDIGTCQRQRQKSLRSAFKVTHLAVSQAPLAGAINRAAQDGSRTPLTMLTLLRCVARQPFGPAVG